MKKIRINIKVRKLLYKKIMKTKIFITVIKISTFIMQDFVKKLI